ncbi:Monothiol glutaredoxin-S14, chloroplastic-like protein [Drosera capensis]
MATILGSAAGISRPFLALTSSFSVGKRTTNPATATIAPSNSAHHGCTFTLFGRKAAAVVLQRSRRASSSFHCLSALTPDLKTTIDKVVMSQKVVLFMKGTKDFPQCGFSNTVVQMLKSLNVPFETINILENEILRQALKEYSSWPTFPQLYIDGEFFGGCDITVGIPKRGTSRTARKGDKQLTPYSVLELDSEAANYKNL